MRPKPITGAALTLLGCLAAAVTAGCAANNRTARYQQALGRAQASIEHARRADAYESASAQLTTATEKVDDAEQLAADGEQVNATRLLDEAQVDANLAAATADNQEIQDALAEVQASIQALREEINRND